MQCADITFNSTATLLSDDECQNATGVSGVAIVNADATSPEDAAQSTAAASSLGPAVGGGLLMGLVAWGLL